jgi:hypothetical protein
MPYLTDLEHPCVWCLLYAKNEDATDFWRGHVLRANRTVGMEHRTRRSAEELPAMLPEHDRRHAPGARFQADPLDSASLCRSALPTPHW